MLLIALLAGCPAPETPEFDWPDLQAGSPLAGVAEASLRLPLGTPLGGYSSRCGYLGGDSYQDKRDSVFSVGFVESTVVILAPCSPKVGSTSLFMTCTAVTGSFEV